MREPRWRPRGGAGGGDGRRVHQSTRGVRAKRLQRRLLGSEHGNMGAVISFTQRGNTDVSTGLGAGMGGDKEAGRLSPSEERSRCSELRRGPTSRLEHRSGWLRNLSLKDKAVPFHSTSSSLPSVPW